MWLTQALAVQPQPPGTGSGRLPDDPQGERPGGQGPARADWCTLQRTTPTARRLSPGIDQVLGKADVGRGPCDGDLSLRRPFRGIGNFDLSSRHLSNFIDFGPLASNYTAY